MQEHGNMEVYWRKWESAFDSFLIASGRENALAKEKCGVFLHVIEKYGREVYEEFDFENTDITYNKL